MIIIFLKNKSAIVFERLSTVNSSYNRVDLGRRNSLAAHYFHLDISSYYWRDNSMKTVTRVLVQNFSKKNRRVWLIYTSRRVIPKKFQLYSMQNWFK